MSAWGQYFDLNEYGIGDKESVFFVLWADTSFFGLFPEIFLVFFGWSNELVIKLAMGGK